MASGFWLDALRYLMDTVGDLLELSHPDDAPALRAGTREYDYRRFRATAYKTGNYLRHCGVGAGATVAIRDVPDPESVFGFLGAALLGATVRFAPEPAVESTVLFAPTETLDEYDVNPGCTRIGYGSEPADPSWAYFEREVWSENPFFPETSVDPESTLVTDWTQSAAIDAARDVAAALTTEDVVAVRGSRTSPETVIGGLLAPLVAGATVLFPDADQTGTVAVGATDAPEALLAVEADPANNGRDA